MEVLYLHNNLNDTDMTTLLSFTENGNTYEVKSFDFIDRIGAECGAAPWMIGRKVKNSKKVLFINGENICGVSYNAFDAKNQILEIAEYMGY